VLAPDRSRLAPAAGVAAQRAGLDALLAICRPAPAEAAQRVRVMVLIPAHNEAASIGDTLRSLQAQAHRPDDVIVVCDNCTDGTAEIAVLQGARVLTTTGNTARKAGALNQALSRILPQLRGDDLVLLMDADSQLSTGWITAAVKALQADRKLGGVCGTYLGVNEKGILRQLQRNEFIRAARLVPRRAGLWVLSGTGTMFRARVLREVARERGRSLPGVPGEHYNSRSITEDYEITLALKTLGWRCIAPPGCTASTEIMPTWRHLFRQRLRWQSGTLTALRNYGVTRVTWTNWARQVFFYLRYVAQLLCSAVVGYSIAAQSRFYMPSWVIAMLSVIYVERLMTVRGAGLKGTLLAALLIPEWCYGMFDGLYLVRALVSEFTGDTVPWGHVGPHDG
jgi:cellulose synthase/poly-beta-1,6-N-acetylglucosamine synthase-like glycosyltransferase